MSEVRRSVRQQLQRAAQQLETLIHEMVETDYLMHRRETLLLASGLRSAKVTVNIPMRFLNG